jgi:RNA polymerase sigma-70 factor (ECF subfamily)
MDEETPMPSLSVVQDMPVAASAWREWLESHGPKLLLFARQQTRSHEDAKDIFQDALVKLVEKVSSGEFVGGQEAWQPYLYTAIRRLAIDLSRRDDRRKRREDSVTADAETGQYDALQPWFENESSDDETRAQLEKSLKDLPAKFSEVILMKIWGDRTFAEIGEILEISQNTAASRYRYGLEALKKSLANARQRGDLSI